jgi:hypothetical protein
MNMRSRSVVPTFRKSRKVGQPIACHFRRKPKLASPQLTVIELPITAFARHDGVGKLYMLAQGGRNFAQY